MSNDSKTTGTANYSSQFELLAQLRAKNISTAAKKTTSSNSEKEKKVLSKDEIMEKLHKAKVAENTYHSSQMSNIQSEMDELIANFNLEEYFDNIRTQKILSEIKKDVLEYKRIFKERVKQLAEFQHITEDQKFSKLQTIDEKIAFLLETPVTAEEYNEAMLQLETI